MAIFKVLYNDFLKPLDKYILTIIVLIIFVVAGYFGYQWFIQPTIENLGGDDIANDNRRSSTAKIMFFSADWCPHCKKAKPIWEDFQKEYNNKEVGFYKITSESVDCTDGENSKIQEYGIDGYPTIILIKDGSRIDYDAKITESNLKQFVSQFLEN